MQALFASRYAAESRLAADMCAAASRHEFAFFGLHFRAGDVASLSRVMRRAAEEDGLWQRLAGGIPPVATTSEAARQHMDIYSALLERRGAQSA